jgi:hypothetical protein
MTIDISKPYRTRSGLRVIGLCRTPRNSCGTLVTYPIKGTVVLRERPWRTKYAVWTDEGRAQAVPEWQDEPIWSKQDLIPETTP